MRPPPPLELSDLATSTSLLALAVGVSAVLRLGIASRLLVAALRTVVQLALIGMALEWVFGLDQPWIVLLVFASMVGNAGIAAVQRSDRRYPGIWATGLCAVAVSSVVTTFTVTEVVVKVSPWYAPRYLLPLLGMVLGNSLTGIALALDRLLAALAERRDEIEDALAVGASRWEALRPMLTDAVRTGIIPIVNSMSVVGIVSLPGMMTGQILAGADPGEAVKYQIVVMFMVASASSLGSVLACLIAYRYLTTKSHQLAAHRIYRATDK